MSAGKGYIVFAFSVTTFVCLSVCLFVCLSVCLSVRQFTLFSSKISQELLDFSENLIKVQGGGYELSFGQCVMITVYL